MYSNETDFFIIFFYLRSFHALYNKAMYMKYLSVRPDNNRRRALQGRLLAKNIYWYNTIQYNTIQYNRTMCPPGYHHNGIMAARELEHTMYGYTL